MESGKHTLIVATNEGAGSIRLDIASLEIKDIKCFPRFKYIHIDFPGKEILHTTLSNTRNKTNRLEMVYAVQDYDASFESLEQPLFYSNKNNV